MPSHPGAASRNSSAFIGGRRECERDAADDDASDRVNELYGAYGSKLLDRLTRKTGSRDLASDIVQETFARLLRIGPAMLGRIEQPDSYLWRISVNLLRDRGRSRAAWERARPQLEISRDELVDQVAVLESRDTLRRLERAIAKLKPKTRDIFLAHRVEGLSYAEIAVRTDLSVKGVEKQMSKAIAKIDRLLDRG